MDCFFFASDDPLLELPELPELPELLPPPLPVLAPVLDLLDVPDVDAVPAFIMDSPLFRMYEGMDTVFRFVTLIF